MGERPTEIELLARDVEAAFHRLPHCPRALTVAPDRLGNILIQLHGRTFTLSALVIERTIASSGWCESVLRMVLRVPGDRVAEIIRQATIGAALQQREIDVLRAIEKLGSVTMEAATVAWLTIPLALQEKGLLAIEVVPGHNRYKLSDAGKDAIAAHRR